MTAHPYIRCGLRGTAVRGNGLATVVLGQGLASSGKTVSAAPYAHDTAASR